MAAGVELGSAEANCERLQLLRKAEQHPCEARQGKGRRAALTDARRGSGRGFLSGLCEFLGALHHPRQNGEFLEGMPDSDLS